MRIDMRAAQQALRECEVFSELNNDELEKIASSALEKHYEAGAILFQDGGSAEELFVILKGKVALQMTLPKALGQTGNRRITVDVVSKNEIVGWTAIVEPYLYTLTAVCLQDVIALSISGNKLRWLLRDDHEIGYKLQKGIIKVITSRLHDTRQVLISERLLTSQI